VAACGLAAGAAVALDFDLGSIDDLDPWWVTRGVAIATYVLIGVYTAWRRPASRFGLRLALLGLFYTIAALNASSDELLHSIGRVGVAAFVVGLAWLFLCFPHDSLTQQGERRAFAWLAGASAVLWVVAIPFAYQLPPAGPLADCRQTCPDNAFWLTHVPGLSRVVGPATTVVTAGILVWVALVLWRKSWSTSLRRRLLAPVLANAVLLALSYAAYTLLKDAGSGLTTPVRVVGVAAAIGVPITMLLGQARGRVFAATSLGQLVASLGGETATPVRVELLLRELLGDPGLVLLVTGSGGSTWLDAHGRLAELPVDHGSVAVTVVRRAGVPVAAVAHDAAFEDLDVTAWIGATASMLLHNAELVDELRESRSRIVAAAQRERLRLERNLHDGAQQRLLAIQMRLAAAAAERGAPRRQALEGIVREVAAAAGELVDLAHGLYPPLLRERGLADGLRARAREAALPVQVVDRGIGRLPGPVEEAVYYCVSEAVNNAAKHGGADTAVTVTLERVGGTLEFAIADDGRGFLPGAPSNGLGLVSMRDRIGAVGGELVIVSEPGRGTIVRGVVALEHGLPVGS
jgi:signal transduction histidine kinase